MKADVTMNCIVQHLNHQDHSQQLGNFGGNFLKINQGPTFKESLCKAWCANTFSQMNALSPFYPYNYLFPMDWVLLSHPWRTVYWLVFVNLKQTRVT